MRGLRSVQASAGLDRDALDTPENGIAYVDLIHGRSRTEYSAQNKEEVGPMQELSERVNSFADAITLLMIIALIALATWLLAHSG
jgi:hypothetical protein